MNRYLVSLVCVVTGATNLLAEEKPARPAGDDAIMVVLELCEIEVDVLKLEEMGFDLTEVSRPARVAKNPAWLRKWTDQLKEKRFVVNYSNPRLATVTGHEAVLDVGPLRETVKPRTVDGKKIKVDFTLETFDWIESQENTWTRGELRRRSSTLATLEKGQTQLMRQFLSTKKDNDGNLTVQTETLTFLTTDIVTPETDLTTRGSTPQR